MGGGGVASGSAHRRSERCAGDGGRHLVVGVRTAERGTTEVEQLEDEADHEAGGRVTEQRADAHCRGEWPTQRRLKKGATLEREQPAPQACDERSRDHGVHPARRQVARRELLENRGPERSATTVGLVDEVERVVAGADEAPTAADLQSGAAGPPGAQIATARIRAAPPGSDRNSPVEQELTQPVCGYSWEMVAVQPLPRMQKSEQS